MAKSTSIIAFDQHAATVTAAVLLPGQQTAAVHVVTADLPTIGRLVARVQRAAGVVRCCYEAGPCGFELQRYLLARGVPCDVIAPTLIPRRPGVRIKTDRRDARQLAILYRAGALTAVHLPSEQEEAARDLLRCREALLSDVVRARHRLSRFLLRHGRRYTQGTAWTQRHRVWLESQRWPLPALDQTYRAYRRTVEEAMTQLRAVEADLQELLALAPFRDRVARLRCFRGIDDLTALTIAAELGDPRRFPSAPRVMAFVGLVPTEYSSGGTRAQGAITKTGNAHLRRVLIEAAWHYRHQPSVGHRLRGRQRGAPSLAIRQAWVAQHRLCRRFRRLVARGKPRPQVVTAVARELMGFLWAALIPCPDPVS